MQTHDDIVSALRLIFQGIGNLEAAFPHRKFTVDGRLVGDIGEVIAELEYGLTLDRVSAHTHDATAPDGRRVSIKATFKNSLTFTAVPDYMIGLQLNKSGAFKEIYNGPGSIVYERFSHRTGIGKRLLSFPNAELLNLSKIVPDTQKIPRLVLPT